MVRLIVLPGRGCKPPCEVRRMIRSEDSSWCVAAVGFRVQSDVVEIDALAEVAALLQQRNQIDASIARIVQRPMTAGHLGEWIASRVFDIELEVSATAAAIDGRFRTGSLAGETVNVKWYLKREGILDMSVSDKLDNYLVLAGPRSAEMTSRGGTRPWQIDAVYLFDAKKLLAETVERGVKVGVATSVRNPQWRAAEIYPEQINPRLMVGPSQVERLGLFRAS